MLVAVRPVFVDLDRHRLDGFSVLMIMAVTMVAVRAVDVGYRGCRRWCRYRICRWMIM